jgi:triosephosphate isomerase
MQKPIIIANWKLNKTKAETKSFIAEFAQQVKDQQDKVEILLACPFTSIDTAVTELAENGLNQVKVAAQDISQYENGAYTGEINADMLQEAQVRAVIVGHSERRTIFNEDDEVIKAKTKTVLDKGFKLIFCCGESLETREADKTDEHIAAQIKSAFSELDFNTYKDDQIVIAYEPIWAIGTGKVCDSDEANRVIKNIRNLMTDILPENIAKNLKIQYGGSVKPGTIAEQMSKSNIDGALVGGASLKANDFAELIKNSQVELAK